MKENYINKIPIGMQICSQHAPQQQDMHSEHIRDIAKPKTVEQICEHYGTKEGAVHCSSMECTGYKAYFCYYPKRNGK